MCQSTKLPHNLRDNPRPSGAWILQRIQMTWQAICLQAQKPMTEPPVAGSVASFHVRCHNTPGSWFTKNDVQGARVWARCPGTGPRSATGCRRRGSPVDSSQRFNQTAAHPTKRPTSRWRNVHFLLACRQNGPVKPQPQGTETREGYPGFTAYYLGARQGGNQKQDPRSAAMAPRSPCRAGRGRR